MFIKRIALLLFTAGNLLFFASPVAFAEKRLVIATGPTGGVYLELGGIVAKILQDNMPGVTAVHEVTSASVENIHRIAEDKADIAFAQIDAVWDGYKGYGKFTKPQPIRTLAAFFPQVLQLVTLENSGIVKFEDLRGRRVSTGNVGSATDIMVSRYLVAKEFDPDKDIIRHQLPIAEAAKALKEKKIDAFFWASAVPIKPIAELANDPTMKLRFLETASAVPQLLRRHGPIYTDDVIPANTYKGQTTSIKSTASWAILIVKADADEKLVYDITKTLFEHKADIAKAHVQGKHLDLAAQARGDTPIPFHAGAKKYLAEKKIKVK